MYGGGSIEIFEINLLRTWGVDTESRISPKYAAMPHLFFLWLLWEVFLWLLWEGKGVVCQMHAL